MRLGPTVPKKWPLLIPLLSGFLLGCSADPQVKPIGSQDPRLSSCPEKPSCVSSDATKDAQKIAPLQLKVPATQVWAEVNKAIPTLPRTEIITATDDYLHAECRSAVFGFVDDLELQLRLDQQQVAVRSAARWGYYDFGVNRERVEELRRRLRTAGVIH